MSDNLHFVPFSDIVIRRYQDHEVLPAHNRMDPRLLHGEIHVTLTAVSPVMISGGSRKWENGANVALFSTDARNRFRIPGSSLRGLIRQNMQILGLGAVCAGRNEDIPDGFKNYVDGGREPRFGLPRSHQQGLLDYSRSVMGFVMKFKKETPGGYSPKYQGKEKIETVCYRSRISVGELHPTGTPRELPTVLLEQSLPRQSSPSFIEELGGKRFRLKGFRQYPPIQPPKASPFAKLGFRPLAAGTRFTGTIRYRNLAPDELGLLLWCLRLEEGCVHAMGMGKAAGYGQMALTIDKLVEFDPQTLYSSLTSTGTPAADTAKRVDELIQVYRKYAAQPGRAGQDPAELDTIKKFLSLRKDPNAPVPKPQAAPKPIPQAAPKPAPQPGPPSNKELRRQAKQAAPQATQEQKDDWRKQFGERFQKN